MCALLLQKGCVFVQMPQKALPIELYLDVIYKK